MLHDHWSCELVHTVLMTKIELGELGPLMFPVCYRPATSHGLQLHMRHQSPQRHTDPQPFYAPILFSAIVFVMSFNLVILCYNLQAICNELTRGQLLAILFLWSITEPIKKILVNVWLCSVKKKSSKHYSLCPT